MLETPEMIQVSGANVLDRNSINGFYKKELMDPVDPSYIKVTGGVIIEYNPSCQSWQIKLEGQRGNNTSLAFLSCPPSMLPTHPHLVGLWNAWDKVQGKLAPSCDNSLLPSARVVVVTSSMAIGMEATISTTAYERASLNGAKVAR